MGRGGACCSADVDTGDENAVEDMDAATKAKAQAELEGDDDYEPTGSGRIPGSKYTITEIDILECTDKKSLEKCVKEHNATSRGESSCCGGKGGLLVEWSWVPDLGKAAKLIRCGRFHSSFSRPFFPRARRLR